MSRLIETFDFFTSVQQVVCRQRLEPHRTQVSEKEKRKSRGISLGPRPIDDPFTERYQLVVWEAWGYNEFLEFKSYEKKFKDLFGV